MGSEQELMQNFPKPIQRQLKLKLYKHKLAEVMRGLPDNLIDEICEAAYVEYFTPGDVVIAELARPKCIYMIMSGTVGVFQSTSSLSKEYQAPVSRVLHLLTEGIF